MKLTQGKHETKRCLYCTTKINVFRVLSRGFMLYCKLVLPLSHLILVKNTKTKGKRKTKVRRKKLLKFIRYTEKKNLASISIETCKLAYFSCESLAWKREEFTNTLLNRYIHLKVELSFNGNLTIINALIRNLIFYILLFKCLKI